MKRILPVCLVLSLMLFTGWGKKQLGEAIPSNVQVAKLQDIVRSPQSYKDREVVLEGNYGFYCCPTDFSYKEGVETVEVSPIGFDTPKEKPGRPMKIYGIVKVDERKGTTISIEAKGIELK